jgi:hypothetical protein
MVPDVVEFCEALSRISSGNVDRARVAGTIGDEHEGAGEYVGR